MPIAWFCSSLLSSHFGGSIVVCLTAAHLFQLQFHLQKEFSAHFEFSMIMSCVFICYLLWPCFCSYRQYPRLLEEMLIRVLWPNTRPWYLKFLSPWIGYTLPVNKATLLIFLRKCLSEEQMNIWKWSIGVHWCPLTRLLPSPCISIMRRSYHFVWNTFWIILRGESRAAYSNWSNSSEVSCQPRAPKFSSACFTDLTPGIGIVPLDIHQLIAICNATLCYLPAKKITTNMQ